MAAVFRCNRDLLSRQFPCATQRLDQVHGGSQPGALQFRNGIFINLPFLNGFLNGRFGNGFSNHPFGNGGFRNGGFRDGFRNHR